MQKPPYSELPRPMAPEQVPEPPPISRSREVIVVGGGLAGLSAAIYLGRAMRDVLVIDAGESLAIWEPEVQNYLGFPEAVDGRELLRRGREQAQRYGVEFICEEIGRIGKEEDVFRLKGKRFEFDCRRLLLATGVYHLPPKIAGVNECVGKSMFFCKDCDGYRVQGKRVIIAGHNEESVEYALGMMTFTDCVLLMTNGEVPHCDSQHEQWLREYQVPICLEKILNVQHEGGSLRFVTLATGEKIAVDCLFTTRGDVFHNHLARQLGATHDQEGQIVVDKYQRTNVSGLYAAGCVTPANCQMIIAAGDGGTAAQEINSKLFTQSLSNGSLRRHRGEQLERGRTEPLFLSQN